MTTKHCIRCDSTKLYTQHICKKCYTKFSTLREKSIAQREKNNILHKALKEGKTFIMFVDR